MNRVGSVKYGKSLTRYKYYCRHIRGIAHLHQILVTRH